MSTERRRVILHLGGNLVRLETTIFTALMFPDALILVSSEDDPVSCIRRLDAAGISRDRYRLDFAAWDTVTNFTETKAVITARKTDTLIIVSDWWHLIPRARWIARAVYWRSGVKLLFNALAPGAPEPATETRWLAIRDAARAWCWRLTGLLYPNWALRRRRMPAIQENRRRADALLGDSAPLDCGGPGWRLTCYRAPLDGPAHD